VQTLYEARKAKGMNLDTARDYAQDVSYFGTLMVYRGDADGMVSGQCIPLNTRFGLHSRLSKLSPIVRSSPRSFLCVSEDRVLVYGDCAVNPDPSAEELAEIALSSAETAQKFGIEPRIALLSYSSGQSGKEKTWKKYDKQPKSLGENARFEARRANSVRCGGR
jgi:phosphate acetyltransferase